MLLSAHSVALHAARTSAQFAAVISALDTDLNSAIARKAELEKAEDKAIFGDGDLAEVRAALAECNSEIGLYEKAIGLADERRIEAARNEAAVDVVALGKDAKAKANALGGHLHRVYELIEEMRGELFKVDALSISLGAANGSLEAAGRRDLMVNVTSVRRQAMSGPRAAVPNRASRKALQADKMLLSFLTLGGVLDRRAAVGNPVGEAAEIKGIEHHAAFHTGRGD
ncbi:hypothetical protein [Mesorhizobium ventifaucium]|nr:hypothetical protein [Mesorhizobium ventifaucium]